MVYQKTKHTLKKGNVAFTFQIGPVEREESQNYGVFTKLQDKKKRKENKQCTVFLIERVDKLVKNMLQTPNKDQHLRGNTEWSQAQLN
jgi:hypothetical protein